MLGMLIHKIITKIFLHADSEKVRNAFFPQALYYPFFYSALKDRPLLLLSVAKLVNYRIEL